MRKYALDEVTEQDCPQQGSVFKVRDHRCRRQSKCMCQALHADAAEKPGEGKQRQIPWRRWHPEKIHHYNLGGTAAVINSTFANNEAGSRGGGMANLRSVAVVTNCTISENISAEGGGLVPGCEGSHD